MFRLLFEYRADINNGSATKPSLSLAAASASFPGWWILFEGDAGWKDSRWKWLNVIPWVYRWFLEAAKRSYHCRPRLPILHPHSKILDRDFAVPLHENVLRSLSGRHDIFVVEDRRSKLVGLSKIRLFLRILLYSVHTWTLDAPTFVIDVYIIFIEGDWGRTKDGDSQSELTSPWVRGSFV